MSGDKIKEIGYDKANAQKKTKIFLELTGNSYEKLEFMNRM